MPFCVSIRKAWFKKGTKVQKVFLIICGEQSHDQINKESVQTRKQKRKDYFKRASRTTSKPPSQPQKAEKAVKPVNYKKLFVLDVTANYSTCL